MKWVENGIADVAYLCSDEKKNVLLIGDSIRIGYCGTVKEELAAVAEVFYPPENCRSTQNTITSLKKWAALLSDPDKIDLVHFNCGQWDVAHWNGYEFSLTSEDEYARNISMLIFLLKKFFKNAKLVFATTSPMNPLVDTMPAVNPRNNAEVNRYNEIAVEVCNRACVPVNDVHGYMCEWGSECYTDTCHLTKEAFEVLGKEIAKRIKEYLN